MDCPVRKHENKIVRIVRSGAWVLLPILLIAFFAGWLPLRPVAVATGSMEPTVAVGDVVVTCPSSADNLHEGDIVRYHKGAPTVIHRIVACTQDENGGLAFITQGDSNNTPDADPVLPEQILGKVIFNIPKLGYLSLWMHGMA